MIRVVSGSTFINQVDCMETIESVQIAREYFMQDMDAAFAAAREDTIIFINNENPGTGKTHTTQKHIIDKGLTPIILGPTHKQIDETKKLIEYLNPDIFPIHLKAIWRHCQELFPDAAHWKYLEAGLTKNVACEGCISAGNCIITDIKESIRNGNDPVLIYYLSLPTIDGMKLRPDRFDAIVIEENILTSLYNEAVLNSDWVKKNTEILWDAVDRYPDLHQMAVYLVDVMNGKKIPSNLFNEKKLREINNLVSLRIKELFLNSSSDNPYKNIIGRIISIVQNPGYTVYVDEWKDFRTKEIIIYTKILTYNLSVLEKLKGLVIINDASASPDLFQKLLPNAKIMCRKNKEIHKIKCEVYQLSNKQMGAKALNQPENYLPMIVMTEDIIKMFPEKEILMVSRQTKYKIKDQLIKQFGHHPNIQFDHYGNTRGLNKYEDCEVTILFGGSFVSYEILDRHANAMIAQVTRDQKPSKREIKSLIKEYKPLMKDMVENSELRDAAHRTRPILHEGKIIFALTNQYLGPEFDPIKLGAKHHFDLVFKARQLFINNPDTWYNHDEIGFNTFEDFIKVNSEREFQTLSKQIYHEFRFHEIIPQMERSGLLYSKWLGSGKTVRKYFKLAKS